MFNFSEHGCESLNQAKLNYVNVEEEVNWISLHNTINATPLYSTLASRFVDCGISKIQKFYFKNTI